MCEVTAIVWRHSPIIMATHILGQEDLTSQPGNYVTKV